MKRRCLVILIILALPALIAVWLVIWQMGLLGVLLMTACLAAIVSAVCLVMTVGILKQLANELSELKKAFFQFRASLTTIIRSQRETAQGYEEAS